MTDTELTDLITRTCAGIDPPGADVQARILGDALSDGRRRRSRHRRRVATAWTSAALVVAVTGAAGLVGVLDGSGPGEGDRDVAVEPTTHTASPTPSPTAATTYAPGTGPVIATERRLVPDAALADVTAGLVPPGVALTGLEVEHVGSRVITLMNDTSRDGRRVSFLLDGASASVTLQRWDGYAAVAGPARKQRVTTTAREACQGAYRISPAPRCTQVDGGWLLIEPGRGDDQQELWVSYYTDDGFLVGVVAPEPRLDRTQARALVTSPRWFTTR
ncbi:hypothetical protein ABFU82_25410 [Nocardioides sp. WV_118_6]